MTGGTGKKKSRSGPPSGDELQILFSHLMSFVGTDEVQDLDNLYSTLNEAAEDGDGVAAGLLPRVDMLKDSALEYLEGVLKWLSEDDELKKLTLNEIYESGKLQEIIERRAGAAALLSVIPRTHIKPNNKLAIEITRDFINEGEIALRVSKTGARREITTRAALTYESENISLSGKAKFTPYDREVHDGVVTLYAAGNEVITPAMVYRAMNGMTETEKISPQSVGAVTRSLDKSRKTTLKVDFSEEARAYKKDCKATYEGYLLACDKITVSAGGKTQEGYRLLRKPFLYEYAQMTGQILNIPIELLQTKDAIRSTDEVIVIRGYLLRQIAAMKSKSFSRNNKIAFDSLYLELDILPENYTEAAYKKKTHTVRQHVEALLSEWERKGYIKEHRQYIEGKIIKGLVITL